MSVIKKILQHNSVVIVDNFLSIEKLDLINEYIYKVYTVPNPFDNVSRVKMNELLDEFKSRVSEALQIHKEDILDVEYNYKDTSTGNPIEYKQDCISPEGKIQYSACLFLDNVEAGGQLDFVDIGKTIDPVKGRLVIWDNLTSNLECNSKIKYDFLPVIEGNESFFFTRVKVSNVV